MTDDSDIDIDENEVLEDFIEHYGITSEEDAAAVLEHLGISTDEELDEFLEHFGVRGMKWGVHREARVAALGRIESGKAKRGDRFKTGVITKTGAGRVLDKVDVHDARIKRIASGKGSNAEKFITGLERVSVIALMGHDVGSPKHQVAVQRESKKLLKSAGSQRLNKYLRSNQGRVATRAAVRRVNRDAPDLNPG